MDKGVFGCDYKGYLGVFWGKLVNPEISEYAMTCDFSLQIGPLVNDWNTAFFSAKFPETNRIQLFPYHAIIDGETIENIYIEDVIN